MINANLCLDNTVAFKKRLVLFNTIILIYLHDFIWFSVILFSLFDIPHLKNKNFPRTSLEQNLLQGSTCICKLDCKTRGKGKRLMKRICQLCPPSTYKRWREKPDGKQNGRETLQRNIQISTK